MYFTYDKACELPLQNRFGSFLAAGQKRSVWSGVGRVVVCAILLCMSGMAVAQQEAGNTLPPNYRRIAKEVKNSTGEYFYDSLMARYGRCDTALTVDHLRCLYYGGTDVSLADAWQRYFLLFSRFGNRGGRVNEAWTQYQMLLTAVWSTGDGSRRHPLHVRSKEEARQVVTDFGSALWFKIKGKRRFSVAPQP